MLLVNVQYIMLPRNFPYRIANIRHSTDKGIFRIFRVVLGNLRK